MIGDRRTIVLYSCCIKGCYNRMYSVLCSFAMMYDDADDGDDA